MCRLCPVPFRANSLGGTREGDRERMDVLWGRRVDNPQQVMKGGERSEADSKEETWDTRSNTTCLKTSASTWHCAFYCSRVAARQGLVGRGRRLQIRENTPGP